MNQKNFIQVSVYAGCIVLGMMISSNTSLAKRLQIHQDSAGKNTACFTSPLSGEMCNSGYSNNVTIADVDEVSAMVKEAVDKLGKRVDDSQTAQSKDLLAKMSAQKRELHDQLKRELYDQLKRELKSELKR